MIACPKPPKREKKSPKRPKFRRPGIEQECDDLFRDCVYIKANFKSEKSGIPATVENGRIVGLNCHHLAKKRNYWLRYSLLNGYCCTEDEHLEFHFEKSPQAFDAGMKALVGPDRWATLLSFRKDNTLCELTSVREDLKVARQALIDLRMKEQDTSLLRVYLKQIGVAK